MGVWTAGPEELSVVMGPVPLEDYAGVIRAQVAQYSSLKEEEPAGNAGNGCKCLRGRLGACSSARGRVQRESSSCASSGQRASTSAGMVPSAGPSMMANQGVRYARGESHIGAFGRSGSDEGSGELEA